MTAHRLAFDPITLEVLRNALEATAQEMGGVLKLTSFSPNIKERMDASCAIFDAKAQLVAQAEHVPVHLGSMLKAVGPTIAMVGQLDPGDVVIVNDPFVGGAHLPDITLIAPAHVGETLIGYVATRAHHSDVGGMEPGSMPGKSSEIYQEGIIIPPVRLYRRGELQADVLRLILANVRTATERRGDLNAQLAAIRIGERRLGELAERYGARACGRLRCDPGLRRTAHAQPHRRAAAGSSTSPRTASTMTAAATSRSSSGCAWRCRATGSSSISRGRHRSAAATSMLSLR